MLVTTVSSLLTHCKKIMTKIYLGHCVMLMMTMKIFVGFQSYNAYAL